jgi:hypothetical protein
MNVFSSSTILALEPSSHDILRVNSEFKLDLLLVVLTDPDNVNTRIGRSPCRNQPIITHASCTLEYMHLAKARQHNGSVTSTLPTALKLLKAHVIKSVA